MPRKLRPQGRSQRLLAESEAAHAYLDLAMGTKNDLVAMLNLEKAFRSFGRITTGIDRGHLDPMLEQQILAAHQGLQERLYNVTYAVADP